MPRRDSTTRPREVAARSRHQSTLLADLLVVRSNGDREWRQHGRLHRVGAPALLCADGETGWFLHGHLHREDGPAVENSRTGLSLWFLHGRPYAKPVWLREVLKDRPLTTHQRELLFALSENWAGTPELLYQTACYLGGSSDCGAFRNAHSGTQQ